MKRDDIYRDWLALYDTCIYCNKTVENLLDEIKLKDEKFIMCRPLEKQIIFLNENSLCLTDEEFIIKQIIE